MPTDTPTIVPTATATPMPTTQPMELVFANGTDAMHALLVTVLALGGFALLLGFLWLIVRVLPSR